MLIIYIYCCAIISFPNNIVIFKGEEPKIKTIHGINIGFKENKKATQVSSMFGQSIYASTGTKIASLNLFNKIPVKNISIDVIEKTTVIPLGNVIGGTSYLRPMLDDFAGCGQYAVTNAVAAYNAGPAAVYSYNGCPPYRETQDYVIKVSNAYNRLLGEVYK